MAMRQVDIQARSVEEAVRLALEQMGRSRDQVDVQVLAGNETGSEDDEVLVRVTAREQLSGARERTGGAPREALPPREPREPREADYGNRADSAPPAARPDRFERAPRGDFDRGP